MSRQNIMTMVIVGLLLFVVGCSMIRKVRRGVRRQFSSRMRAWLREETGGPAPPLTHVQVSQPSVAAPVAVASLATNPAPAPTHYA